MGLSLTPVPNMALVDERGFGTRPLVTWMNAVKRLFAQVPTTTAQSVTPLFDHFTDASNSASVETDLYTDTLAAGQLATNGDKIFALYTGTQTVDGNSTKRWRVYFGGAVVADTGAVASGVANYNARVEIIRVDASNVRVSVLVNFNGGMSFTYTAITGLTLANTQIIKLTGLCGSANANVMTTKMGFVYFMSHA